MNKHLKKLGEKVNNSFYKQPYYKIRSWVNKSDFLLMILILTVTWLVALLPSELFYFLWLVLNPETFWPKFVTILFIGGPLLVPQLILLFGAIKISIDAISEVFK